MQYGFDTNQLSLKETINSLIKNHFKISPRDPHESQLNEIVKANIMSHLMDLGQNSLSSSITKAVVYDQIVAFDQWLAGQRAVNFNQYYRN